ncbi:deoxyribodipyrimidine photo-lyase [Halopseudomonas maritima]|uniref:deoxyribodipyrimidine photo-lyase n=1 Tax=Halopseudomonas maritima TaxID=2918528 RepID=UPI001EEA7FCC|nr:deoxyribodipyrimidine photo-lyase [Halopseudomonas maritima]UJJ33405.1 deoxyribodipyrimidine photo-lyase [Halopseudomonas maritima]
MQLCWLRTDLRLHDNHALWHASQQGPVVAVYVVTPNDWRAHDDAPIKIDFWRRNLIALQAQLTERNIPLRVLHADSWADCPSQLLKLAQELEVGSLHFNDEYGLHEQSRDDATAAVFADAGLSCQRYTDQLLFAPGSLTTQSGTMYKVYSQFRKQAYKALHRQLPDCLPAPERQTALPLDSDPPAAGFDAFECPSEDQQALWPAGEQAALERLEHFCAELLEEYAEDRDRPDLDVTSRLSAYLAAGVLSPRQCLHAALRVNRGEFDGGNRGAVSWINELLWREFYKHILVCYPRVSRHRAFRPETEVVQWRTDADGLAAWQQGRTGIPLVDAAMRQLLETGWMHNRLRMVSAMFLTKNLLIDWREGERWFMQHLIDGDLAANNGGWQWSASTGTDAAPYFRVFNPVSQSQKCDPDGSFIRQWLPELAELAARDIHLPPQEDLLSRDHTYPAPIVDLRSSRQRAIDAFRQAGETA